MRTFALADQRLHFSITPSSKTTLRHNPIDQTSAEDSTAQATESARNVCRFLSAQTPPISAGDFIQSRVTFRTSRALAAANRRAGCFHSVFAASSIIRCTLGTVWR
jgi:hypothetical protein